MGKAVELVHWSSPGHRLVEALGTGDTPDTGVVLDVMLNYVSLLCLCPLVDKTIGP